MPRDHIDRAFLGVSSSLTGRFWSGPSADEDRAAEAMIQATGLPDAVARILSHAGVAPEAAQGYLAPRIRELLPDPLSLRDMAPATDRFLKAVRNRERIAIFGDYDVDGGASAALLINWLRAMGGQATLYIPDRVDEGYGPNEPAMADLARNHDLILCVDCGTLSHGPIASARGADVIVLDHHLGGETLPDAVAVVNPNRQDEDGALGHLCAAAVVFLMLVEANRRLRAENVRCPDLMSMLDLVALATVADVAPLIGVNRALVQRGLAVMGRRQHVGLTALADVARLDCAPRSHHLGFVLGPRINAGGRVGRADLGARLLSCTCPDEAASLAAKLEELNADRRAVETAVRTAALAQAEARGVAGPLVWAAGAGWHPGVVGIVAARLKEATGRPAVVIGIEDGIGKGSARSIPGIDLGAAIQKATAEGLLLKGGGHRMAAGLTVSEDLIEPAMDRLGELLGKQGAHAGESKALHLTGLLMPGAVTPELIDQIECAGPFGPGAPAPRFAFADCRIVHARRVGDTHLKVTFSDGTSPTLQAIAFGAFDGPLGEALSSAGGDRFHLAGRLEINHWQGRQNVQLRLEDAARL